MTNADVIAQTNDGADIEDVYKTLQEERAMAADLGLVLDTDAAQVNDKGAEQGAGAPAGEAVQTPEQNDGADGDQTDNNPSGADDAKENDK